MSHWQLPFTHAPKPLQSGVCASVLGGLQEGDICLGQDCDFIKKKKVNS